MHTVLARKPEGKRSHEKHGVIMWTGFIWLRIETGGGLL
jgi:hypothetical protein